MSELPWDVLIHSWALASCQRSSPHRACLRLAGGALHAAQPSQPRRLLVFFAVGMYLISGLVNNLTALLLVLPILHILLKLLGYPQRYVSWTLACSWSRATWEARRPRSATFPQSCC